MAGGLFTLIVLSIVMALASFTAGMLPLAIQLSQRRLRLLSTLGMGVLVGTSLIVIIPEGIDTLYATQNSGAKSIIGSRHVIQENLKRLESPPIGMNVDGVEWLTGKSVDRRLIDRQVPIGSKGVTADREDDGTSALPELSSSNLPVANPPTIDTPTHDNLSQEQEEISSPHRYVGLSLVSGFILMYLIDQLPHTHALGAHSHTYSTISVHTLRSFSSQNPIDEPPLNSRKSFSTTLGLVIHAAADGIALGASSTSSNSALEIIVFFAIMLHKAPAAFGLSTVLLRTGLTKRQARSHLIVFSLAAPAGALLTWIMVTILGDSGSRQGVGMQWWTGILLLFSGGTFLYVAMHTMQETASSRTLSGNGEGSDDIELNGDRSLSGGGDGGGGRGKDEKTGVQDIIIAVFGMLLPLITQVGHHH